MRNLKGFDWLFSYLLRGILPLCTSLILVALYIEIFRIVKKSKNQFSNKSNQTKLKSMSSKIIFIILTNACCWLPLSCLGVEIIKEIIKNVTFFSFFRDSPNYEIIDN